MSLGIMLLLMAAAFFMKDTALPENSMGFVLGAILLSSVSGVIAYAIVYSAIDTRITLFTAYVSASMILKMMIGIMGVFVVALRYKEHAAPFVLSYFFCYFIFTGLEVYWLMRKLRPISKDRVRESKDEEPNT
jgi:hypothetical protein